jgi:nitrite reductase/ring-hydroxylating ferredoxin subunit
MSDRAAAGGFVRPFESGRLVAILVVDIALPWLAVTLLEARGVALSSAIAAAAVFPLGSVLISWLRRRRIEFIGLAVVVTMLGGIGLAMASGDVRFSLVKMAPAFGLFGAACLASLFADRPLMFYVARYFSTAGDAEKAAAWDARLAVPGFRRAMRLLTIVWGVALLLEAAAGIAVAILVVPEAALVIERVLGFGTIAGLLAWTTLFARRRQAQGQAMALAAQAAALAEPEAAAPLAPAREAATPAMPLAAPGGDPADEFHQCWYPVALSSEIAGDTLAGQDFLGTRIIIYRDAAGRPVVQSAWCPHLGADLSVGQLADGKVRCAFHHWSFDQGGRCVHIPTGDKIPPGARIATYPAAEAFGFIWAFNGATPLFPPPTIPDAEETELVMQSFRFAERANEVWVATSNGVDFQHLHTLHGLPVQTPPLLDEGPYGLEYSIETPFYLQHGRIAGTNCFAQHLRVQGTDMFMLFCGSAMGRARTMSYYAVGVKRGPAAEAQLAAVKAMVDRLLAEDAPVLSTIRFRKGVLVASDRHLGRFFRYVETFPTAAPLG